MYASRLRLPLHLLLGAAALAVTPLRPAADAAPPYRWGAGDAVDGCEVSTSPVEGKPYVAARAVCVVPAGLDAVAAVLADIERYPEWMKDCAGTKVLQVVDRERDVYLIWFHQHVTLFTDRDMVLRSEVVQRDERRRVIRASATSTVPHDSGKGYVRMPSFSSEWVLEALDAAHTRVSFTIDPDLGPGLPTGIANARIRATPLGSLQGLARIVAGRAR
jgi:ribosome-associated toxin RatA of RatAB toxin-antitoxin module